MTFAAGATSASFTIAALDDDLDEDTETFTVVLSGPSGATIADGMAVGTIRDSDGAPTLSFEAAALSGAEDSGGIGGAVVLNRASGLEVRVGIGAVVPSGTATRGRDYTVAETLVFAAGETRKTFAVTVVDDVLNEGDETFSVELHSARNALISSSAGTATGTIMDDDPLPSLSIANARVEETPHGARRMVFPVRMSATSGRAVTVNYATSPGTAVAGADYLSQSGTLTFLAGSQSNREDIRIEILDDELYEGEEAFTVVLSGPSNATLGTATGTGTIEDDEDAPRMSIADAGASEARYPRTVDFAVTLSVASGSAVTVNYATSDGSATAGTGYGNDYTETTGTLTFAAGETRKSINVPLRNDDIYEGEESFTVGLNNAMGTVTMSRATATGSIEDDEEFPVLSIVDLRMDEGDAAAI